MSSTVFPPGHIIAERYRIEQLLGQGGMGSVYRALQLPMERTVAIKLLVDEHLQSPSHLERFQREAQAMARLTHPNTVRLFDYGTAEHGYPFLVMEYLTGLDLAQDLERRGPMRWDHALEVCRQVLGSLGEAHEQGIVHRDIKPANIFLSEGERWPWVKLLDFGIAGATERDAAAPRLTQTGTVVGSASYMSPEQAQGKPVAPAADIYAAGVVLFEMLAGRTPFHARVLTAQLLAKLMQPAPRLGDVCPELDIPAPVQDLVAELLERDPSRRPGSARAAAARIEALLGRAALPPLRRADQTAPPPRDPGVPRTELMLVPHTIDEGWAPPRTHSPAARGAQRARAQQRRLVLAAVVAVLAGASALLVSRLPRREPEEAVSSLLSAPEPLPAVSTAASPAAAGPGADPGVTAATAQAPAAEATPAAEVEATSEAGAQPTAAAQGVVAAAPAAGGAAAGLVEPAGARPSRSRAAREVRAGRGASSTRASVSPEGEPGRSEPAPRASRAWTVASARAAAKSGEITPARRNGIIQGLRQRRLEARARAARDYREGRITRLELRQRQREIEREIEGN